jgi:hypothetical protein
MTSQMQWVLEATDATFEQDVIERRPTWNCNARPKTWVASRNAGRP